MIRFDCQMRGKETKEMSSERQEEEKKQEREERKWSELPSDVLSVIFKKVGVIDTLMHAQFVCRPWRHVSFDPAIWKVIDIRSGDNGFNMGLGDLERIAREGVDRSQGQLEVFCIHSFGSDALLRYVADRTSILKCLRLISTYEISDLGLSEIVRRLPQLEELDITLGSFTEKVCEYVGKTSRHLKCFRLNAQASRYDVYESDEEALGIANNMPELHLLQLVGNKLTNKGLNEILDKCVHLEYLDLRCCFHVNLDLDANLQAKCARINVLRLPNDRTDDCGFLADCSCYGYFIDLDAFCPSGYPDIDLMYDDMYLTTLM